MKIYLTGSITRTPKEIRDNYLIIKKALEDLGHSVFTEHIIGKTGDDLKKQDKEKALEVQRIMAKRKIQADLIIAETSIPSLGVGQEISFALDNDKQVIALYLMNHKPHLLRSVKEDLIDIVEYNRKTLKKVLKDCIEENKERMDVRFNFFVSPKIVNYLDWVAKKRKIPRAVYLRGLIKEEMDKAKFE